MHSHVEKHRHSNFNYKIRKSHQMYLEKQLKLDALASPYDLGLTQQSCTVASLHTSTQYTLKKNLVRV